MYVDASPVLVLSPWPRWSYITTRRSRASVGRDIDEVDGGAGETVQQEERRIARPELVVAQHHFADFDLLTFRHCHGVLSGSPPSYAYRSAAALPMGQPPA